MPPGTVGDHQSRDRSRYRRAFHIGTSYLLIDHSMLKM